MFAARHGLSRAKLRYWLRRVEEDAAGIDARVAFAPVEVLGETRTDVAEIDIVLATGERVIVRPGVSVDLIRTVLTAVRSPC